MCAVLKLTPHGLHLRSLGKQLPHIITALTVGRATATVLISPLSFSYWYTTSEGAGAGAFIFTGEQHTTGIWSVAVQGLMVKWLKVSFALHVVYVGGCSKPYYCSLFNTKQQFRFTNVSLSSGKNQLLLLSNMIYFQPFIKSIWLKAWRGIKQWCTTLAHFTFVRMKL